MTVKSVVDIDIKDARFKKFLELWEKFRDEAKKLPDEIKAPTPVGGVGGSFDFGNLAAMLAAQATFLQNLKEEGNEQDKRRKKQQASWDKITDTTKTVAGHVINTAKNLFRWTSISSLISGLVGAGSLWGLDKLADNTAAGRKHAFGLGTTVGEQRAFNVEYGRFIDPDQFLGGVNQALHDVSQRVALLSLGVPSGVLQTNNAATVGNDLLLRLKDLADRTNPMAYEQAIQARGLGGIVSVQDMTRLHGMSRQEVLAQQSEYTKRSAELNKLLSPKVLFGFQQFKTQLDIAGAKIEAAFVKGIAPLTPGLSKLSDSVAKSITTLLTNIKEEDVARLGKKIEEFATYLGSPEFQKDIKDFTTDIHTLATTIADALHILGKHSTKDAVIGAGIGYVAGAVLPGGPAVWGAIGGAAGAWVGNQVDNTVSNQRPFQPKDAFERKLLYAKIPVLNKYEKAYDLPSGTLAGVYGAESDYGRNSGLSKAGALGDFQFMPGTAKQYGVDRLNFESSARGAGLYLRDLMKRYKGDIDKALAAYNWGEGHLDVDISQHGNDWRKYLPKETKDYIEKVHRDADIAMALGKVAKALKAPVKAKSDITIRTNPGSNATDSAKQAAAGG